MSNSFESSFTYLHDLADKLSLGEDHFEEFKILLESTSIYTEEPLEELYDPLAKRFHNLTIDAIWTVFRAGKISELAKSAVPASTNTLAAVCKQCNDEFGYSLVTAPVIRRSKILTNVVFCTPDCMMSFHEKVQPDVAEALFDIIDIRSTNAAKDIREYLINELLLCGSIDDVLKKKGMSVAALSDAYLDLIK